MLCVNVFNGLFVLIQWLALTVLPFNSFLVTGKNELTLQIAIELVTEMGRS